MVSPSEKAPASGTKRVPPTAPPATVAHSGFCVRSSRYTSLTLPIVSPSLATIVRLWDSYASASVISLVVIAALLSTEISLHKQERQGPRGSSHRLAARWASGPVSTSDWPAAGGVRLKSYQVGPVVYRIIPDCSASG